MDVNSGIRVAVVPAQSAFFAGESFSVSVTFTNVRSPNSPVKRATSHSHKRAVHSISSAPLARPPTSPVTPRTAVPPILTSTREANKTRTKHERKGLIGSGSSEDSSSTGTISRSSEQWRALSSSGTSPLRNASLPANHPHARKQSVQDATLETQLQLKELSSPAPPGSASTSAFSLSLDTISENNADTHQYPPRRRPPNLGLGLGAPPRITAEHQPPHTAFSSTFVQSGAELLLYAYAQLSGTVMLCTDSSQGESLTRTQALNAVRYALQRKQAFGGGRMDISSSLDGRPGEPSSRHNRSNGHARAASLSTGLMSLLSPPTSSHQPWIPSHKARSPSLIASLISPSVSSPASISSRSGTDSFEEVTPETPLPTFEVQPVMLAVDLVLAPGQSRTYTYSLPLPETLPPTYRGRGVKFSYHLTVGVCRANPGPYSSSSNSRSSTSQVMRVPVRIYSHVDVSGIQRPYDLLWPISHPPGKEWAGHVSESGDADIPVRRSTMSSPHEAPNLPGAGVDHVATLRNYALNLLDSVSGHDIDIVGEPAETKALSPMINGQHGVRGHGDGELTGCREAVEILTRNMRKVSYDVNKDGLKVAVLTFTKSAYRLGETIVGIVELNEISSRARVLKLSAMLEAHETLPSSLDPSAHGAKKLRKLHAEFHTSLTLSTLRTSFSLDIPSDAAPAFQYTCAPPFSTKEERTGDGRPGGLAWTVRLCLLVCVTSPHAKKGVVGVRMKGLLCDGPHGEWGTAWRPTRGIAPLQNIDARAARRAQQREALSTTMKAQQKQQQQQQQRGWASYFLSGLLTPGEREYHDGDEEPDDSDLDDAPVLSGVHSASRSAFDETRVIREGMDVDIDLGGGDEGWSELRAETVECEVPIRVWPGNTAFKPMEVVFDV
ncbi:Rgp1-domain-containing protein [Fomitiporia mediterranea MF3/22]|uniref:Rgp1-domain-containing protein n=1 Tax=Fomitiporia mediterranea (strain MF3/22) TaxID=694068 RepID=UPI00044072F8|nr:Rgp1-domain-containing protein [Fomitiporia mediterranea MF3/22]EJD04560.1 Rgp1-domain-containing protein [Fomitiporia mediterranea MF3/22]